MAKAKAVGSARSGYSEIALSGAWSLTSPARKGTFGIALPCLVHTARLDDGEIPAP